MALNACGTGHCTQHVSPPFSSGTSSHSWKGTRGPKLQLRRLGWALQSECLVPSALP